MSTKISDSELIIKPLDETCDPSSFFCKDSDLNDFLKNDALHYQKHMISRTNLCFLENRLVGYITLAADSIAAKKVIPNDSFENKYGYPALKIARLAVDSKFEKRGIGTHLLHSAIGKAVSISKSIGCRLVLVDSKNDAIHFYENNGFRKAILGKRDTKDNYTPMYFDLQPVLLELYSNVEGSGNSTANIQLIDYNEKII